MDIITQTQNAKYRIISNKTVKFSIRGKNGATGHFSIFRGDGGSKRGKCSEKEAKSTPWYQRNFSMSWGGGNFLYTTHYINITKNECMKICKGGIQTRYYLICFMYYERLKMSHWHIYRIQIYLTILLLGVF